MSLRADTTCSAFENNDVSLAMITTMIITVAIMMSFSAISLIRNDTGHVISKLMAKD